jgi:hypothetical protein
MARDGTFLIVLSASWKRTASIISLLVRLITKSLAFSPSCAQQKASFESYFFSDIALEALQTAIKYGVEVLPGLIEAYMTELITEKIYKTADIVSLTKCVCADSALAPMVVLKQALLNATAQQFIKVCDSKDLDAIAEHFATIQGYEGVQVAISKVIAPAYRNLIAASSYRYSVTSMSFYFQKG